MRKLPANILLSLIGHRWVPWPRLAAREAVRAPGSPTSIVEATQEKGVSNTCYYSHVPHNDDLVKTDRIYDGGMHTT